jgi:hypothetical protein
MVVVAAVVVMVVKVKKSEVFPFHTMKIYTWSRGVAPLILNLGTRGSPLYPGKISCAYCTGFQSQARWCLDDKNLLLLPGLEHRTVQYVV